MSHNMTSQRRNVLWYVVEYQEIHHFSPSYHEIMAHIDSLREPNDPRHVSTSSVGYHFQELSRLGFMYYEPNVARGYAPTQAGIELVKQWKTELEQENDHASKF